MLHTAVLEEEGDEADGAALAQPPRVGRNRRRSSMHLEMGRIRRMSNAMRTGNTGDLEAVVAAAHGPGLERSPSLSYSNAANAARAMGPTAFGRISLPGRTVSVNEAASLYTSVILPEPGSFQDVIPSNSSAANVITSKASNVSGPDGAPAESSARAARNARLIVVGGQGELMSTAAITSTMQSNTWGAAGKADDDKYGGSWGEDHKAQDVAGDADQTSKVEAALSSGNNSSSGKSAKSGEERWVVLENNELAINVDGKGAEMSGPGSDQLMQLAAAIRNLPVPAEILPAGAPAADDAPVMPMITAPEKRPQHSFIHHQPSMDFTMNSIFGMGGLGSADNNLLSECAVIPTVPENIYNHTIAAVPNFKEKQKPPTNWTFAITNICLLLALAGAAFVEVYVPNSN
jgi:hypothetical protein